MLGALKNFIYEHFGIDLPKRALRLLVILGISILLFIGSLVYSYSSGGGSHAPSVPIVDENGNI